MILSNDSVVITFFSSKKEKPRVIIARYAHRLPADYDLEIIRTRAKRRGPQWDAVPELYFKAFLLRESGRFGASANSYSSLYLWRRNEPFRDFLAADDNAPTVSFKAVTSSFGRPQIQTWLVLDACKGAAQEARFIYTEEVNIPTDAELPFSFAREVERNREIAARSGTIAAIVGVDTLQWMFIRILLTVDEPDECDHGKLFQIAHLSRPLLDTLPQGASE